MDAAEGRALAEAHANKASPLLFQEMDVTREADVRSAVSAAHKAFGRLDAVVNCAGIYPTGKRLEELSDEEWDRTLAVNLTSVFRVCRACLPILRAAGGGSIVNIASVHAVATVPGVPAYAATKAAVLGLSRQMALDYAVDRIRVNAVLVGSVATRMTLDSLPKEGPEAVGLSFALDKAPQNRRPARTRNRDRVFDFRRGVFRHRQRFPGGRRAYGAVALGLFHGQHVALACAETFIYSLGGPSGAEADSWRYDGAIGAQQRTSKRAASDPATGQSARPAPDGRRAGAPRRRRSPAPTACPQRSLLRREGPLYRQLATLLRQPIVEGGLAPGTELPREADLAERYGISLITVRHALRELEAEGLIKKRPAKPAVVSSPEGRLGFNVDLQEPDGDRRVGDRPAP